MVIHSGDESNSKGHTNLEELHNFLNWYSKLDIPYKILVAGNHSFSLEKRWVTKKELSDLGIIYLEHEYIEIEGIKIFGSPYTPTYGTWCFMKDRATINRVWQHISDPVDILVLHGPPKGILDLAYNENYLDKCGDNSLHKLIERVTPKLVLFGHIHDNEDNLNFGVFERNGIIYSNASAVKDGRFKDGIKNHGNILKI